MPETTPDLLLPQELAARWRMHRGSLANLRSAGTGPAFVKLGAAVRYRLSDVIAFEDAGRRQTMDTPA